MNALRPFFCCASRGLVVALEIQVEGRVRSHQGRLVGLDGQRHVVEADRLAGLGEGLAEGVHVFRDAAQGLFDQLRGTVHLDAVLDRTLGLLPQVLGTAIPELRGIEHGVEDRR